MGQYHIIQKQLVLYFTIFHYISLKHESAKDLQKAFVTLWEFFNHWHRRNGHFVFISFLNVWSPFEWPVFMGAGQSQVGDQMCRGTAASAAVPRCFQFSFHIFHIFHIVFGSFFTFFEIWIFISRIVGMGEWNALEMVGISMPKVLTLSSWGRCYGSRTSPAPLPTLTLLDGDGDPRPYPDPVIPERFHWDFLSWQLSHELNFWDLGSLNGTVDGSVRPRFKPWREPSAFGDSFASGVWNHCREQRFATIEWTVNRK